MPTSLLAIEQLAKLVAVGTVHSPLTGSVGDSASGCRIHLISTKDLGNELAVPRLTRDLGNELASLTGEFPKAGELDSLRLIY